MFQHEIDDIWNEGYQQGKAEALSIDMDKPMHFTDEQKAWIKNYIIINAKRQRADAIDEFLLHLKSSATIRRFWGLYAEFDEIAEHLKEQTE